MITQIFYSQVLFPSITYDNWIDFGNMKLESIEEIEFGKFKTIFRCRENADFFDVYFVHKDFAPDKKINTNYWFVYGNEAPLVEDVISIINHGRKKQTDFNFFKNKEFYDKIPFGTVLSITSKCNIFCDYCFNDYDYPLDTRNTRPGMTLEQYKFIVDELYNAGTRDIILTGGEPFVCPFIWDLLDYLKEKNIFIRINTNGTLLSDNTLKRLNNNYVVCLMVSIHEFNNEDYFKVNEAGAKNTQGLKAISNFEKKFEKKVIELRKIKYYKNLSLDVMTILNSKNILNLEKIYEFILGNFKIEEWHFFRLYSTGTTAGISRVMISLAIAKIHKLNKIYSRNFKIVDSVPFCATKDTEIAKHVIDGELSEHHNVKTIITTDGGVQIMSAFDTTLGSMFEDGIDKIWKGEFVQGMLNNGFLPKECQDCKYKQECRGGSRMDGNIYNGSYNSFDPLGNINNKKVNDR